MSKQTKQILELFSQPAFLAKDDKVFWCNTAAKTLVTEGTVLADIIEDCDTLFSLWSCEGMAQISVILRNQLYNASVKAQEDCLLFVISDRSKEVTASASAMLNASVSLRKPLHSLLSAAAELFENIDISEAKDAAAQVNKAIYQLMRLCGQMSDGSRLLLQRMEVHRKPVNLQKFFDSFVYQVRPLIEAAGRTLQYTPLQMPVKADIDDALMERALFNLISNALSYTEANGTLALHLQVQAKRLLVTVSDNGEGISSELLGTIFERQTERPIGDSRWGLGYGLPMVREIARLHDGTMMITANENGCGTSAIFSVSLEPTTLSLHSPMLHYDYCGGLNHALVELSDALGKELYDPLEI
ncbi:MAG: HAMP domain-containing histidine kinase [Ruminococcaceae bacterium]|nr:HAMP domain-containing histidine kinase [Oscillospiraceae bacterium]